MKKITTLTLVLLVLLWGCSTPPGCEALERRVITAAAAEMACAKDNIDVIQHEQLDYFSVWLVKNAQANAYRIVSINENQPEQINQYSVAAESAGFLYFEETEDTGFGVIYLSNPKSRLLWLKLFDPNEEEALFKDSMGIESTLIITRLKPAYKNHYRVRVFENSQDVSDAFHVDDAPQSKQL